MWELKNFNNKDYVEGFKDGAGFVIVAILAVVLMVSLTVGIAGLSWGVLG